MFHMLMKQMPASRTIEVLKNSCGPAGRMFVDGSNEGSSTGLVNHPAFRRIDWKGPRTGSSAEIPVLVSEDPAHLDRFAAEVFEWSYGNWRGLLGEQISTIISGGKGISLREGAPWVLGYVWAVGETLIDAAEIGQHALLSSFIRFGVWADVYGLDRVDELKGFFDAIAEGIVPNDIVDEYESGVVYGESDMRLFLECGECKGYLLKAMMKPSGRDDSERNASDDLANQVC